MEIVLKDLKEMKNDINDELYKLLFTFYKLQKVEIVSDFKIKRDNKILEKIDDLLGFPVGLKDNFIYNIFFIVGENKHSFELKVSYGDKGYGKEPRYKITNCSIEGDVYNQELNYWISNIYSKVSEMKESELKDKADSLKQYINSSCEKSSDGCVYGCLMFIGLSLVIGLEIFLFYSYFYLEATDEPFFWICSVVEVFFALLVLGGYTKAKDKKKQIKDLEKEI